MAKSTTTKSEKSTVTKKATKKVATKAVAQKELAETTGVKAKKSTAKKTAAKPASSTRFAVVKLGSTQLKVMEGAKYELNKISGVKGDKLEVSEVLLVADGADVKLGKPYVDGASVTMKIDSQKKADKVRTFNYKAKSRYRKTHGMRAHITRVLVEKINA